MLGCSGTSGTIQPANTTAWFTSYGAFLAQLAQIASEEKSDALIIGTELKSLSGAAYRDRWVDLIQNINQVYGGYTGYAANWDEYRAVSFWDRVSFIGIEAYFPLSNDADPSLEELTRAWWDGNSSMSQGWLRQLSDWRQQNFPSKSMFFTEVGYVSADYATRRPWEYGSNCNFSGEHRPYNGELQAQAYRALILVQDQHPTLDGIFWWNWEPKRISDASGDCSFPPQGKPAEIVLKEW